MNFHIKTVHIDTLAAYFVTSRSNIIDQLAEVQTATQGIVHLENFSGMSAEKTKAYYRDVHSTLLAGLDAVFMEISNRYAAYMGSFLSEVDGNINGHFDSTTLQNTAQFFNNQEHRAESVRQQVNGVTQEIADILHLSQPQCWRQYPQNCSIDAVKLKNSIVSHERQEAAALAQINCAIRALGDLITEYENQGSIRSSTYTPYSLVNCSSFNNVMTAIGTAYAYQSKHASQITDAYEQLQGRMQVREEQRRREEAKLRQQEGQKQIIVTMVGVLVGTAITVATAGAGAPVLATALAGSATAVSGAFALSNMVEGAHNYYLGGVGDISTKSFNPFRDVLFGGNEDIYQTVSIALPVGLSLGSAFSLASSGTAKGAFAGVSVGYMKEILNNSNKILMAPIKSMVPIIVKEGVRSSDFFRFRLPATRTGELKFCPVSLLP
jgi:hypothetical protein